MEIYLQKLTREIELRGLAKSTKVAYLRHVKKFLNFHDKDPKELEIEDIKKFLHHVQHENPLGRKTKKRSPNSVNNHASAIAFFYLHVFNRNYNGKIPRMKTPKTTPTILSMEEINLMIDSLHNLFWKAIIMTLYTTGMRQSELRNLKITDIDSKRMVIYIRNAKGSKDRQAILSPRLLNCLRMYWKNVRTNSVNSDYIFLPRKSSYKGEIKKCLSHTAVGHIVKRAAEIAGVKKKFTLTA